MTAPGFRVWERGRRALLDEVWNIGVVDQPVDDIARRGIVTPVRWLPDPAPGTMLADPSCRLHPDGGATLYAEYLALAGRRLGEVWSAEVAPAADLATARFTPMLQLPHHMSYPFPLAGEAGQALLTAETWQAGGALLWDGTRQVGTIMPGRQVVDPTLWRDGDRHWLFCTFQDSDPNGALHLYHAPAITGPWTAHPGNPVQTGRDRSRPAGPLFRMGNVLVRPAQDCSATYGGAVVLHAVTRLDAEGYAESVLRRLDPVAGRYGAGLHTICAAGQRTLVDGKRWVMTPSQLPGRVLRAARRLGRAARPRAVAGMSAPVGPLRPRISAYAVRGRPTSPVAWSIP